MPLVVHYWADLQSVHGLRCYGNITRTRNVSEYMLVLALYLAMGSGSESRRKGMRCPLTRSQLLYDENLKTNEPFPLLAL